MARLRMDVRNLHQPLSRASAAANRPDVYAMRIPPKRSVLYSHWPSVGLNSRLGGGLRIPARHLTTANQKLKTKTRSLHHRFFSAEARTRRQQRRRFIRWWTLTSLVVVISGVAAKIRADNAEPNPYQIKPSSWSLYAYSTLPLKSISRLWGQFNSIDLPVWLRSPSYRLYSAVFGVRLDEMKEPDLTKYSNLSDFFYRPLKEGVRPIADAEIVSPSDGRVLGFGIVENGEIEQVKGMTYSIDALLGLNTQKLAAPSQTLDFEISQKDHESFAKSSGLYNLNELSYKDDGDKTAESSEITKELSVASKVGLLSKDKSQLYFAVIYLAPGDYHRYHSPVNWVTTLRRHFIGELFSVAPFFQKTLQGLFVLNERVALLGYWKYGFFSMIPVGATNVGSIVVNFDKDLKTNERYEHEVYSRVSDIDENEPLLDSKVSTELSPAAQAKVEKKRLRKNTVYEATYGKASRLLGGYPLAKGEEVGGFKLGSTVVLVFEGPEGFRFDLEVGGRVRMGEALGRFEQ